MEAHGSIVLVIRHVELCDIEETASLHTICKIARKERWVSADIELFVGSITNSIDKDGISSN